MRFNPKLKEKIMESLSAVLPVTGIVLALSILVVPIDLGTIAVFLSGAVLLVIGMGFFQLGAEMSMEPRVGTEEAMRFWGISVQPERELVLILVNKDEKKNIMKAIGESCGMRSEAHGVVLSLPVDGVVGLE